MIIAAMVLAGCTLPKMMNDDSMMKDDDAMMSGDVMMSGEVKDDDTMMEDDDKMMSGDAMMKDDDKMDKDDSMMKDDDAMMSDDDKMMKAEGTYEAYSEAGVEGALAAGKKVVLFFHASWCPTCRALDTEITSNLSMIPDNSVIFKVNYDAEGALKKKYLVNTQHTLVAIDSDMNMTDKSVGGSLSTAVSLLQ